MTEAELDLKILSLKEQLFKLRGEITTGRIERPHRFKLLKREIAQCFTILREKEGTKKARSKK